MKISDICLRSECFGKDECVCDNCVQNVVEQSLNVSPEQLDHLSYCFKNNRTRSELVDALIVFKLNFLIKDDEENVVLIINEWN